MARGEGKKDWDNPRHLQVRILERFMAPDAVSAFIEQYKAARKIERRKRIEVTENDIAVANVAREFGVAKASSKLGIPMGMVMSSVRRVAFKDYMTK
jgi:hypothetical protein